MPNKKQFKIFQLRAAQKVLERIYQNVYPSRLSYKIKFNLNQTVSSLTTYSETHNKLLEQYGQKENGQLIRTPSSDGTMFTVPIDPEKSDVFNKEEMDLLSMGAEIEYIEFTEEEMDKIELSAEELEYIEFMTPWYTEEEQDENNS